MEKILYNAMFSRIQKEIKNNKEEIERMQKIDNKYCKINIAIEKLLKIIGEYKKKDLRYKDTEKIIYCNGNPYIVLNLAMIAIVNNINMKINIDDSMRGVNKYLLTIINNILKANKLEIKIELFENLESEKEKIFIDRINDFNILKRKQKNIKFIPYKMIDVYIDCEEYEELLQKIYEYATSMNIDIDVFDEEEGVEGLFKYGDAKTKLILTKQNVDKYKSSCVYVNENPFKIEKLIFDDEMIKEILDEN